ncbi:MAG: maltose ABC transporter permease MalF [Chitinivibrionales bacterium]|nr:maltose ABC transporter permease MalF [Chitinivibrionales bacterium]
MNIIFRLLGLAIIDAFGISFVWHLFSTGNWHIAIVVFVVTLGLNLVFLIEKLYPLRWFSPGLTLMIVVMLYPMLFTVYMAFTNYSDGHLLTKPQVLDQLAKEQYLPEGGESFSWTAFISEEDEFALWLQKEGESYLAYPDEPLIEASSLGSDEIGELDEEGIPKSIPGYERLNRIQVVRYLTDLQELEFGEYPHTVRVKSLDEAAQLQQRYIYDPENDTITDKKEDKVYKPIRGTFTSEDGEELRPGYWVPIGFKNFARLFTSPALSGPFLRVFVWTFAHAFFTVLITFAVGLFFSIVFNQPDLPGRKLIRSLTLIPYAIPAFISVNVWRGLFNPHMGKIALLLEDVFGSSPLWFANPWWAKIGILIVQLWLGFPYMMLICTGSLQSIPQDMYEAAEVDGANAWQKFWNLTLPMLLVSVGPLLIASFSFNFNNFTVIDIYNEGGPPIPGTPTPAGHTDILITYIFRLAFASGRGSDYGYASAITIVIFVMLAVITAFQFRYTRVWEEVSENV